MTAFADNEINVTEKLKFVFGREEKIVGFFFKVLKSQDCVNFGSSINVISRPRFVSLTLIYALYHVYNSSASNFFHASTSSLID